MVAPIGAGSAPVPAGRADQPARRLGAQVGSFTRRVGAFRPERRAHGVDDPFVARRPRRRIQAPFLHRPGLEVGDHDVGVLDQTEEHITPSGQAEVDGDAALSPVVGREKGGPAVARGDREPPALIAETGKLDLDDVGPPLLHGQRRLWALDEKPSLKHPNPVERPHAQRASGSPMAGVIWPPL